MELLQKEAETSKKEIESLQKELESSRNEAELLKKEAESSRNEVELLKKEAESSSKEIESLNNMIESSNKDIESLKKEVLFLKAENILVREKNAILEAAASKRIEPGEDKVTPPKNFPNSLEILDVNSVSNLRRIEKINRGGQSDVFKVSRDEIFALKVLLKPNPNSSTMSEESFDAIRRLLTEYEILNSLHHPNIVRCHGICFRNDTNPPSILLEFCPQSLDKVVKDLTDFERVTVIYELSVALREVHLKGIIHRDVKPGNVLLDDRKHVKLSDFGISCLANVVDQTMTSVTGTFKVMAPELLNEQKYDEKVDVYSFGIVVFYILTGGELPQISIGGISSGKQAPIPKNINTVSRDLISKCWSFKAKNRPSFDNIVKYINHQHYKLIDGIEEKETQIISFLGK